MRNVAIAAILCVAACAVDRGAPAAARLTIEGIAIQRTAAFDEVALPAGWTLASSEVAVEIKDQRGRARARAMGRFDVDGPRVRWITAPVWGATSRMAFPRRRPTLLPLGDGRVFVVGGANGDLAEVYDPSSGTFTLTRRAEGNLYEASAALLRSGRVMVVTQQDASIFDPVTSAWKSIGAPCEAIEFGSTLRAGAGLGPSGEAFVFAGRSACVLDENALTLSKVAEASFDLATRRVVSLANGDLLLLGPAYSSWPAVYSPRTRSFHKLDYHYEWNAVNLPDGTVLTGASVFDPATRVFRNVPGAPYTPLVLLPDGRTLHAGTPPVVFDPRSRLTTKLATGSVSYEAGAALLSTGRVLVAGGQGDAGYDAFVLDTRERAAITARNRADTESSFAHGIPGAAVGTDEMVVCGETSSRIERDGRVVSIPDAPRMPGGCVALDGDEVLAIGAGGIYDTRRRTLEKKPFFPSESGFSPGSATSTATHVAILVDKQLYPFVRARRAFDPPITLTRRWPAAVGLSDGRVLVLGGDDAGTAEIFDLVTRTSVPAPGCLREARTSHVATVLPDGQVLLAGGYVNGSGVNTAERYDPRTGTSVDVPVIGNTAYFLGVVQAGTTPDGDAFVTGERAFIYEGGALRQLAVPNTVGSSRYGLAITRAGRAVIAGNDGVFEYDRSRHDLVPFPGRVLPLRSGELTVLPDGRVLHTGDGNFADLYLPDRHEVEKRVHLGTARKRAAATLLSSGRVLVTGGGTRDVESFDPVADRFSPAGTLAAKHDAGAAMELADGRVLISDAKVGAEIFDPASGTSRAVAATTPFQGLARLPSGRVLAKLPGATSDVGFVIFDPKAETVRALPEIPPMTEPGAIALPSGEVLITSGSGEHLPIRFDEATGAIGTQRGLATYGDRFHVTGNGLLQVLSGLNDGLGVLDGTGVNVARLAEAELHAWWSVWLPSQRGIGAAGPNTADPTHAELSVTTWSIDPTGVVRPVVSAAPSTLKADVPFELRGERFMRRASAASPDPEVSPLVTFVPLAGGGPLFAQVRDRDDTRLTATLPLTSFAGGGWLHVVVEGVSSDAHFVRLEAGAPGAACKHDAQCAGGNCVEGVCCDRACAGGCESCRASLQGGGTDGLCGPIAANSDPKEACPTQAPETCGGTGACNGAGACAHHPDGLTCSRGYRCRGGACPSECTSNLECADGYACSTAGRCDPAPRLDRASDAGCAAGGSGGWLEGLGVLAFVASLRRRRRRR